MKKFLKILAIIIAVLILLPLIFLVVLHFVSPDISEVDDQDLIVTFEILSEPQNVYFDLLEAQKEVVSDYATTDIIDYLKDENTEVHLSYDSGGEVVEGFGDDDIDEFLNENKNALNLFEMASQKNKYQDPIFDNFDDLNWDTYLSNSKNGNRLELSRIVAVEALYELKNDNDEAALNKSLELAKVGQMIIDSNDTSLQKLVGISIKTMALETANYILSEGDFDSDQLNSFKEMVANFDDSLEGIYNGYKVDYMIIKNTVDYLAEEGEKSFLDNLLTRHNFYFKSNGTKQIFADHTRKLLNNEPVSTTQFAETAGILTENYIGKVMVFSLAQSNMNDKTKTVDAEYEKFNDLIDIKLIEAEENSEEGAENDEESVPVKRR